VGGGVARSIEFSFHFVVTSAAARKGERPQRVGHSQQLGCEAVLDRGRMLLESPQGFSVTTSPERDVEGEVLEERLVHLRAASAREFEVALSPVEIAPHRMTDAQVAQHQLARRSQVR
jgi:hypothetical protein